MEFSSKRADPIYQPHNDVSTNPETPAVHFHQNTASEQATCRNAEKKTHDETKKWHRETKWYEPELHRLLLRGCRYPSETSTVYACTRIYASTDTTWINIIDFL